jgi:hypothetical protein
MYIRQIMKWDYILFFLCNYLLYMLFWEDAWAIVCLRISIPKFNITYTSSCKYPISIDYLLDYITKKKQRFGVEFESSRTIVKIYETKFILFTVFYPTNILNYLKCMPWRIHLICLSICYAKCQIGLCPRTKQHTPVNLTVNPRQRAGNPSSIYESKYKLVYGECKPMGRTMLTRWFFSRGSCVCQHASLRWDKLHGCRRSSC